MTMLFKGNLQQSLSLEGEREQFKDLLRSRLIGCGWRDQVVMLCRDIVRERGVHNITVQDLVGEITTKGRALVPDSVKKELLLKIKTHLTASEV